MIFLNLSSSLILTQPTSVDIVTYVIFVEADSPAQEAGLIVGDHVSNPEVLKFAENSSAVLNVTRKVTTLNITLIPEDDGYIGAHFSPIPYFVPIFSPLDTTVFSGFLHFILVNILTLLSCFLVYEYFVKRIGWFRPLFGVKNT